MRSLANVRGCAPSTNVVWTVGSLTIVYDVPGARYVLVGDRGPICSWTGRSGLRAAYDAAVAMVAEEVGNAG